MKFGVCVAAKISNIDLIEVAEELGYESAWVADSQTSARTNARAATDAVRLSPVRR